jgi:hypothetical protein
MLEAMTMAEHEGNVYCKQCYARKFGIRGVGFGVGAGALAMDTGDRYGNTESLPYVQIFIDRICRNFCFFLEINQIMLLLLVLQQLIEMLRKNK